MFMFSKAVEKEIKSVLKRLMSGVMERRLVSDPFIKEEEASYRPFHYALAPEIVWKGSKFERSLVTSLGQIGWEQIAKVIANDYHGHAENGRAIKGITSQSKLHKIQSILDQLEHRGGKKPDWNSELKDILNADQGEKVETHVTIDLYIHNTKSDDYYYCELKSPKPNSDQTKVSKEKMFKIKTMYPEKNHKVYYALPFNPYGRREDYDHPHPKRWFDMLNDEVVVMGKEFWDLVGGDEAYEQLIKIFEKVGKEYSPRIKKDYFGISD